MESERKLDFENYNNNYNQQLISECFHEVQNILSVIQANTQVLDSHLEKKESSECRYTKNILKQLKFINEITRNSLHYVHNQKTFPISIRIDEIFNEIKFMYIGDLSIKGIDFEVNFEKEIPELYIDYYKLKEVLINLINNAVEAVVEDGNITVNAKKISADKFMIKVQDNGCGISENNIKKIFEPLYTNRSNGTGLGLAITRRLINKMQGEIKVESKPDHGTTFYLILPVEYQK